MIRPFISVALLPCFLIGCDRQPPASSSPPDARAPTKPPSTGRPSATPLPSPPPETLASIASAGLPTHQFRVLGKRSWGHVCGFEIKPSEAESQWRRYRGASETTGFYPVIVGDLDQILHEDIGGNTPPGETLAKASGLDARALLQARADEVLTEDEEGGLPRTPDFDDVSAEDVNDPDVFAVLNTEIIRPSTLHLIVVPTRRPWEVLAYLDYGGWNEYPYPHEHVAIMKRWHDLYGAEPVIVTGDVIEMLVERPPSDDAVCRELALEQFAYTAGDLVYQGYSTFGNLRRALRARKHWFFWWD